MKLKNVRDWVGHWLGRTKMVLGALCVWGLVFSVTTISRLAVAFDYDDTLVLSAAAYQKAFAHGSQPYSPGFWSVVNQSYDLEKPKLVAYGLAWIFRVCGFRVSIMTTRPEIDAGGLRKEWRHLIARGGFIFVADQAAKHAQLQNGNYVLYFGDSDSDIAQARKAKVFPVRIKRSRRSMHKNDYHPKAMGEWVLPLSQY
ncbi:MAG: hypothetical protein A3J74_07905 [Elusimicrobia bacterium RIFCSPHIGHO2_02_FULL_57_9]|nr:MAG: hypothetical protein A3J74_07905 [Elusimicrobia bacterium RIFCSPHIGHO2_02_FULL_57_9]